jgi:hypothetical protein
MTNLIVLRLLVALHRARLLAGLAGLAGLLGVSPPTAVRVLLAVIVVVALLLDALADAVTDTTLTLPADSARGDRS